MLKVKEELLGTVQDQLEAEGKLRKKDKERLVKLEGDLRALEKTFGKGKKPDREGEAPSEAPTGEPE